MNSKKATWLIMQRYFAVWQNCGIDAIIASRFPRRWATAYLSRAHVGKLNARIIWFFMKQRRIILVHGIRNKGQAIPACDFDRARERMGDWQERREKDELRFVSRRTTEAPCFCGAL
jgi:hypothetical protein